MGNYILDYAQDRMLGNLLPGSYLEGYRMKNRDEKTRRFAIRHNGKVKGPLASRDLRHLIRTKQISFECQVRDFEGGKWTSVGSILNGGSPPEKSEDSVEASSSRRSSSEDSVTKKEDLSVKDKSELSQSTQPNCVEASRNAAESPTPSNNAFIQRLKRFTTLATLEAIRSMRVMFLVIVWALSNVWRFALSKFSKDPGQHQFTAASLDLDLTPANWIRLLAACCISCLLMAALFNATLLKTLPTGESNGTSTVNGDFAQESDEKPAEMLSAEKLLDFLALQPNVSVIKVPTPDSYLDLIKLKGAVTDSHAVVSGQVVVSVCEFDRMLTEEDMPSFQTTGNIGDGPEVPREVLVHKNLLINIMPVFQMVRDHAIEDYNGFVAQYGIARSQLDNLLILSKKDTMKELENYSKHIVELCQEYEGNVALSGKYAFLDDQDFKGMTVKERADRYDALATHRRKFIPRDHLSSTDSDQLRKDVEYLDCSLEGYQMVELPDFFRDDAQQAVILKLRSASRNDAYLDLVTVILRHVWARRVNDAHEILKVCLPIYQRVSGPNSLQVSEAHAWNSSLGKISKLSDQQLTKYEDATRLMLKYITSNSPSDDTVKHRRPTIEQMRNAANVLQEIVGMDSPEFIWASTAVAELHGKSAWNGDQQKPEPEFSRFNREAELVRKKLIRPVESVYGSNSAQYAKHMSSLAINLSNQRKNDEARRILEAVVPMMQRHFLESNRFRKNAEKILKQIKPLGGGRTGRR